MKDKRAFLLIVAGNILDYYDFLLFAHLGYIITPFFFPEMGAKDSHLLSMLLFAMPFVIRPIGGYIFGHIADKYSKSQALNGTLRFASFASLGVAFLPGFEVGGFISAWLFFALRCMQGISLGGEYTTAGSLLMEKYKENRGLMSAILCASGTIGSLIAFGFAVLYIQGFLSGQWWRLAFFIGGVATFISYRLRDRFLHDMPRAQNRRQEKPKPFAMWVVLLTGMLVGVSCWLPMVYSNYYFTKVLGLSVQTGLMATFISLVLYVVLNPIAGRMADKFSAQSVMFWGAMLAMPFGFMGFMLIMKGQLLGQVFLTIAAVVFGAPIHVLMNALFPVSVRSRLINTLFMAGTSLGGLSPFISGFMADRYGFKLMPLVLLCGLSTLAAITFYQAFYRKRLAFITA